jgi:hypothetical protein
MAWIAGAAGGLAAYRAVKRPRLHPDPAADGRAEELRSRLQQAREAEEDGGVRTADAPDGRAPIASGPDDLGTRRAAVHEQARAALDEMRGEPDA